MEPAGSTPSATERRARLRDPPSGELRRRHDGRPGMAGLPVGGGEQVQPGAGGAASRAIRPPIAEHVVVGVGGADQDPAPGGFRHQVRPGLRGPAMRRHSASGVPGVPGRAAGRGVGAAHRRCPSRAARRGRRGRAHRGAAGRRRRGRPPAALCSPSWRERSCAQRPAHRREDVVHRAGHHGAHAHRPQAGGRQVGPDRRRPPGPRPAARHRSRAGRRRPRRRRPPAAGPGRGRRLPQPGRDRAGAPGPDRGHPDASVPEAGPLDVRTGTPTATAGTPSKHTSAVSLRDHARPAQTLGSAPHATAGRGRRGTTAGRRRRAR